MAGLLALAGLLLFLWPKKHRKADTDFAKTTTARVVIGSFLGAFLVYAIVVSYASNAMYRYAAFYPLLHILAAFSHCVAKGIVAYIAAEGGIAGALEQH